MKKPAALDSVREDDAKHQFRRGFRTLLQHPLLTVDGPLSEEFACVRHQSERIREWLATNTGWTLHVTNELARLRKTPAALDDATFPAREMRFEQPFTRRRYVLLCLALAELEKSDRQTTLSNLAGGILAACAADETFAACGIDFDLSDQAQRRDLVAVIRLIIEWRVLVPIDGDEEQYVRDEHSNVLYTVRRPMLSALLAVQRGPSTLDSTAFSERLRAIVAEPGPDSEDALNRRLRWRLTRLLLEQAVVYFRDLNEAERAYLDRQRGRILENIADATGLIAEVRQEGIALLDEIGDLADDAISGEGTDGHFTLLLTEYLATKARERDGETIGYAALEAHTADLIAEHKKRWRRTASEPGAETVLTEAALRKLESLRLILRFPHGVLPWPAIARYAVGPLREETKEADLL